MNCHRKAAENPDDVHANILGEHVQTPGVRSVPLYLSVPFILTATIIPPLLLKLFHLCDTHLRNKAHL
jgi:hypothetical protein